MMGGALAFSLYALAGVVCGLAAIAIGRTGSHRRPDRTASVIALALTAFWCGSAAELGTHHSASQGLESLRNLAWIAALYRLFAIDGRDRASASVRIVLLALAFVELLQFPLLVLRFDDLVEGSAARTAALLRVLLTTGALFLVHDLVAKAEPTTRRTIAWSAGGLVIWWGLALNFHVALLLAANAAGALAAMRPLAILALALAVAIGFARNAANLRLRPSRTVMMKTVALAASGACLFVALFVSRRLLAVPDDLVSLAQMVLLIAATVGAMWWLPSHSLRRRARVLVLKHLFRHRYDYRGEWIRFTETIGREQGAGLALKQRAIQALADITDSPAGLLLTPDEDGTLGLEAEWNWPDTAVTNAAAPRALSRIMEKTGFILDFDEARRGISHSGEAEHVPDWLMDDLRAWAGIPLVLRGRLVGLVVLARPALDRRLDWEDFDLLGIAAHQVASYLAEQAGQEALEEAGRFDEFNRRIAFVMHDVKNLSSQMALLVRNAERHADNPEFRKDMLTTLRNSTDKLGALVARLGRYGAVGASGSERVDLAKIAHAVAQRLRPQHEIHFADNGPCPVIGDAHALDQAIAHLAQNAVDASGPGAPVRIEVRNDGVRCTVSIADAGEGMSALFVRNDLFRPFVSTKAGGFGIGAHEAKAAVRAMGGRLEVESREGLGTRFTMDFPIAGLDTLLTKSERLREDAA